MIICGSLTTPFSQSHPPRCLRAVPVPRTLSAPAPALHRAHSPLCAGALGTAPPTSESISECVEAWMSVVRSASFPLSVPRNGPHSCYTKSIGLRNLLPQTLCF